MAPKQRGHIRHAPQASSELQSSTTAEALIRCPAGPPVLDEAPKSEQVGCKAGRRGGLEVVPQPLSVMPSIPLLNRLGYFFHSSRNDAAGQTAPPSAMGRDLFFAAKMQVHPGES
jgi:hypothetical protein